MLVIKKNMKKKYMYQTLDTYDDSKLFNPDRVAKGPTLCPHHKKHDTRPSMTGHRPSMTGHRPSMTGHRDNHTKNKKCKIIKYTRGPKLLNEVGVL